MIACDTSTRPSKYQPKTITSRIAHSPHQYIPKIDLSEIQKSPYSSMLIEARSLFKNKNRKSALEKLKEMIVLTTKDNDFAAAGACFIICALIEYYYRDYSSACEYLVQLVSLSFS